METATKFLGFEPHLADGLRGRGFPPLQTTVIQLLPLTPKIIRVNPAKSGIKKLSRRLPPIIPQLLVASNPAKAGEDGSTFAPFKPIPAYSGGMPGPFGGGKSPQGK